MKQNCIFNGDIKFSAEDTIELVSLDEAKKYIRVSTDISDDDDLITSLIKAARILIENYCCVSLIARTVQCRLLNELGDIELPFGPVNELTEILDITTDPVEIYTLDGVLFKTLNTPCNTELTVTYTTSLLTSDDWKTYIKRQVAYLYEHRGDENEFGLSPLLKIELKSRRRNIL